MLLLDTATHTAAPAPETILPTWRYEEGGTRGRFEGGPYGGEVSVFVVDAADGEGPAIHAHPYSETFVVQGGHGLFFLDGRPVEARAGDVVVVPAGAAHMFRAVGPERLQMVCIHAAPEMATTWL